MEESRTRKLKAIFLSWLVKCIFLSLSFILLISFASGLGGYKDTGAGRYEAFVAFLVYLWLFIVLLSVKGSRSGMIWKLLIVGFWVKVMAVFINYSIPIFQPTQDAMQNNIVALSLANNLKMGSLKLIFPEYVEPVYVMLLASVYRFFGYNLYLACIWNIIAAIVTIYFTFRIAESIFGHREAVIVGIVYIFMPYINFMAFFLNREIIVIMFMAISFYVGILWLQRNSLRALLILPITILASIMLRPENIIILIPYYIFIYVARERKSVVLLRALLFGVVGILIIVVAGNYLVSSREVLRYLNLSGISPYDFYTRAARNIDFGFAYLPDVYPVSWSDGFLYYGPLQSINFLIRPFPWEVFRFGKQLFLIFNNFILYIVYFFSFLGVLRLALQPRKIYMWSLLFFLVVGVFLSSLVQGNAFAAARHREQFIFLLYILASGGIIPFCNTFQRVLRKIRGSHNGC